LLIEIVSPHHASAEHSARTIFLSTFTALLLIRARVFCSCRLSPFSASFVESTVGGCVLLVDVIFAGARLVLIQFLTASSPSGAQLHDFWFSHRASVARQWHPGVGFRKKSRSPLLTAVRVSCEVLSAIRFVCPVVWLSALVPWIVCPWSTPASSGVRVSSVLPPQVVFV
jgi:hypothetical protein